MRRLVVFLLLLSVLLAACQSEPEADIPVTGATGGPEISPQFSITQPAVTYPGVVTAPASTEPPVEPTVSGTEAETTAQAPAGPAAEAGPVEAIIAAMSALHDQESFRVEQTYIDQYTNQISQVEVVLPDRYRMVNDEMEMIIVENEAYIKVEGEDGTEGGYLNYPASASRMISSIAYLGEEEDAQAFADTITSVEDEGTDQLDGEAVRVYSYSFPADAEDETAGTAENRLWVAVSDGLPRRLEMSLTNTEDGDSQIIYAYHDFNANIEIEVPEEVLEIPVGEDGY